MLATVPAIAITITAVVPGVAIAIAAVVPAIAIAITAVDPSITVMTPTVATTVAAFATPVGTLVVVALAIDVVAFAVQHAIEMLAFLRRDHTIGARPGLVAVDALLPLLQATRFAARQLAVSSSLFDTLLLVGFPRIDAPHRLRRRAARSE